jgi:ATP-dependent DNA ligase
MPLDLEPQLSRLSRHLPNGPGWVYEPKWDGFRAMVARWATSTQVLSRRMRQLGPHYPELLALGRFLPPDSIVDGEIVAFVAGGLDFGALQYRLTLSERAARAAAEGRPVSFVAFDLLRLAGRALLREPLAERRARLEELVGRLQAQPLLDVTPQTESREIALGWLSGFMAAGIDGVVAKRANSPYRPGERAWIKVKGERSVEAVVRGYTGSLAQPRLVLGLHAADGALYAFGSTYPLRAHDAAPLRELAPVGWHPEHPILHRWQGQSSEGWTELPEQLVVEVTVTHVDHGRLRHSARFRRWRFDREAASCTVAQLGYDDGSD